MDNKRKAEDSALVALPKRSKQVRFVLFFFSTFAPAK